jgi:hypothetical protein
MARTSKNQKNLLVLTIKFHDDQIQVRGKESAREMQGLLDLAEMVKTPRTVSWDILSRPRSASSGQALRD